MKKGDKVTIKSTGECGKIVACSNSKYSIMLDSGSPFVAQEEDIEIYKKGGTIKNQYESLSAEQVWDSWTKKQRAHFLLDHKPEIGRVVKTGNSKNFSSYSEMSWSDLEGSGFEVHRVIQQVVKEHIKAGQYAKGGNTQSKSKKMKDEYCVLVGNVGEISCESKKEASDTYKRFVSLSKGGKGSAAGSDVCMCLNGEPVKTFIGSHVEDTGCEDEAEIVYRTGGVAGSKHVSVTKGYRMPHGYKAVKGKDKNKRYSKGHPKVNVDKGWRMPKSYKTVDAAYNQKYEKGGNANDFNYSIGGL